MGQLQTKKKYEKRAKKKYLFKNYKNRKTTKEYVCVCVCMCMYKRNEKHL
jgi:hypothetical protein